MAGCNQDANEASLQSDELLVQMYNASMARQKSLANDDLTRSTEQSGKLTYPQYSVTEWKNYLSVPTEVLVHRRDSLLSLLGNEPYENLNAQNSLAMEKAREIMESNEGMADLKKFTITYLMEPIGGPEVINKIAPSGLSDTQKELFAEVATFIDLSGRNLYVAMEQIAIENFMVVVSDKEAEPCWHDAKIQLELLGIKIGVQTLVAIGTGGEMAPLDIIDDIFQIIEIYLAYEACQGRWH